MLGRRTNVANRLLTKYAYRTHSGVMLDLSNPRPEQIRLGDIAHHLARVCRFGGAVEQYYSVASHSVYVAEIVGARYFENEAQRDHLSRSALLHDAPEAFLGDMVSGLKRLCPEYRELEDLWAAAIEAKFGVRFRHDPVIKDADLRARLSECRDLFVDYPREELQGGEGDRMPWHTVCRPLDPDSAEWEFLAAAADLGLEDE